MSERVIDSPMAKRKLLYSENTSDADLNAAADQFIECERFGEALEFLERTRDETRLKTVLDEAVTRGDTFLLLRVEKLAGEEIPAGTWQGVADTAISLGRYYDAYRAILRTGDEEKAEALRAEHMPDYEPFRPEGK